MQVLVFAPRCPGECVPASPAAVIHDRERKVGTGAVLSQMSVGIVAGAAVGVLLGLAFSDLALGTLIGAVVGALCGIMIAFARSDEPQNFGFGAFGQQVAERLPHGGAAVLMLVHKKDPDAAIATLQQYGGTVLRTTLPDDIQAGRPTTPVAGQPEIVQPAASAPPPNGAATAPPEILEGRFNLEQHLQDVERQHLERALRQAGGVQTHAAELLGLSFRQFRYLAKKYGLKTSEGR